MEFKKDDPEIEWTKDSPDKRDFDFDAFLGEESLEDRVTDALDGKELLDPDAYGEYAPDYFPRRQGTGERGRHEAPGEEDTEELEAQEEPLTDEENTEEEKTKFDPNDPRYAAPERPHVVVAEPRKKVYVEPPTDESFVEPEPKPRRKRKARKFKGILVFLVILLVVLAALLIVLGKSSAGTGNRPSEATPSQAQNTSTPAPTSTATPAPKIVMYSISVTSGTGGSISPSGVITVEEGKNASFSITPDSGYVLSQLLIDGAVVSNESSYTFSNVKDNHTIYAVFQSEATPTPPPTSVPTPEPTAEPTPVPTAEPTPAPTATPEPTPEPTAEPTEPPAETEIPVDPAAESD